MYNALKGCEFEAISKRLRNKPINKTIDKLHNIPKINIRKKGCLNVKYTNMKDLSNYSLLKSVKKFTFDNITLTSEEPLVYNPREMKLDSYNLTQRKYYHN